MKNTDQLTWFISDKTQHIVEPSYRLTRLNIDFRYFPDRKQDEQPQLILFVFFLNVRYKLTKVYGTRGSAIIVNTKMGNSALFSSDAAMGNF